jgi:hypothetical protein
MTTPASTAPIIIVNGLFRAMAWISEASPLAESANSEPVRRADLSALFAALEASDTSSLLLSIACSTVPLAESSFSFAVPCTREIADEAVLLKLSTLAFIGRPRAKFSFGHSERGEPETGSFVATG